MHIGDGLIPLWQCAIYYIIIFIVGALAIKWSTNNLDEKRIPLLGVLTAAIFAIQALNIPIPWGTSGHMVGAAIVAIIFGSPYAGFLVLTIVLLVQGFFFADGGISALGANIFNMGVIGSWVGYYGYKYLKPLVSEIPAVFIAGWASIFIAAIACAIEMFVAGTFPLAAGLTFMGLYHAVIGIVGEGLISVIIFLAIQKTRPDLIYDGGVADGDW